MKPNRIVVGFCGAAGAGKDLAAEVLIREFGFTKRSFAEGIRREVRRALTDQVYRESLRDELPQCCSDALFTCAVKGCLDPWEKPTTPEMRMLLQFWGTEFRRTQHPDYWIMMDNRSIPDVGRFVYTDVRFPNEYDSIVSMGGAIIRIERPGLPITSHVSETYWPEFSPDVILRNDGTPERLAEQIRLVFQTAGLAA